MKQGKDRLISAASLFSLIIASVCGVWWLYAPVYQKSLRFSFVLNKPSFGLILIVLILGLITGILVILFRKQLSYFQPRIAAAVIITTMVLIRAMEWANDADFPSILILFSPLSMQYMYITQNYEHWTDVFLAFILTCMLCVIFLFVLIVRKQVHWSWTAVRMTILANVFAMGTIHGGMLTLYPYVLEVLIGILIWEQIIQGIQHWIEKRKE